VFHRQSIFKKDTQEQSVDSENDKVLVQNKTSIPSSFKPEKRRTSMILTKELEDRYGLKLSDSSSESEGDEEITEEKQCDEHDTKNFCLNEAELNNENHEIIEADQSLPLIFPLKVPKSDAFLLESVEPYIKDLSKILVLERTSSLSKNSNLAIDSYGKNKAIIAGSGQGKNIVQPEYMKKVGSMCFTELWSKNKSNDFVKSMKNKAQYIKIHDKKRENECLYKPEKWKREEKLQAKIQKEKLGLDDRGDYLKAVNNIMAQIKKQTISSQYIQTNTSLSPQKVNQTFSEQNLSLLKSAIQSPKPRNSRAFSKVFSDIVFKSSEAKIEKNDIKVKISDHKPSRVWRLKGTSLENKMNKINQSFFSQAQNRFGI